MRETLESRISKANSLLDVLLIMKEKTALDIHVATLAYYQETIQEYEADKGYAKIRLKPFPLKDDQQAYSIEAYCFKENYSFSTDKEIMLVIYCDLNFIQNLSAVDKEPKATGDPLLHSLKYGIAIPLK